MPGRFSYVLPNTLGLDNLPEFLYAQIKGGILMKVPWKKLLSALVMAAAVVIFYGGLLLFAVLFTSLTGWPPYAQYALWAWAVVSLPWR